MNDLTTLITGENVALVATIVALITTAKSVFPKVFAKPKVKRFIPLAPIVLGLAAAFLGFGEAGDAVTSWQDKIVLGALVGFTAGQMYKAGKTSFMNLPSSSQPVEGD